MPKRVGAIDIIGVTDTLGVAVGGVFVTVGASVLKERAEEGLELGNSDVGAVLGAEEG